MIVEPANPFGFDPADFVSLRESLAGDGIDARLALRPERGYGGPLNEVFHVFIEHQDAVKEVADITRDTILAVGVMRGLVAWAQDRWQKDREQHPENPRERTLIVYEVEAQIDLAKGEAKYVATVRIGLPEGEPTVESDEAPPRKPPKAD